MVLGGLANIIWILLWHYEIFPLTLLVMLVLLVSLIVVYLRLGIGRSAVAKAETWLVRVPFSIYLGWITVATVANATSLLDYLNWNAFGLAPETWMVIILAAVLVISALMSFMRRDVAFTLVILWALVGIALKHTAVPAVATPTWVTFGLVILALVAALFLRSANRINHKRLPFITIFKEHHHEIGKNHCPGWIAGHDRHSHLWIHGR